MTESSLSLVRHGQTDWNFHGRLQGRTDVPLNDTGRDQARVVGEQLAASGQHWDVLLSSPLSRARETAEIIGAAVGLRVSRTYEDLAERSFGDVEGYHCSGMTAQQRHDFMEEHGEPTDHVIERGLRVLTRILADYPDQNIMAVSHGTFIRLTAGRVLGRDLHSLANGEVLRVPAPAVAEVARNAAGF